MRRGLRYATALVFLALAGCGPKVHDGNGPLGVPGGDGGPATPDEGTGPHSGSTVPELQKRLEDLTSRRDQAVDSAMSDVATCEELCNLASSICEVAKRLEVIADRNAGNESYQVLKRQAQLECREAKESCKNCVSGFESQQPEAESDNNATVPPED